MEELTQQEVMAQALRRQQQSQKLQGANQNAHKFDQLAAIMQIANNPGAAAAAKMAAGDAQRQFKPVQMGQQGFALPASGEYTQSPMYEDERNATRFQQSREARLARESREGEGEANRVLRESLAASEADRKRESDREGRFLRMTLAGMAGSRNSERADERRAAADEKKALAADKDIDSSVRKLQAAAEKKQLPRLLSQGKQLYTEILNAGDNEVPGFSTQDQVKARVPFGDRLLSPKALDNMSALQGVMNALTRADAGLSQTQGEVLRQQLETFHKPTTSAKTRAQIVKTHILPLLDVSRTSVLGSANQAVRDRYRSQQQESGGDAAWMDSFDSLSPAEQAELAQLKAMQLRPSGGMR